MANGTVTLPLHTHTRTQSSVSYFVDSISILFTRFMLMNGELLFARKILCSFRYVINISFSISNKIYANQMTVYETSCTVHIQRINIETTKTRLKFLNVIQNEKKKMLVSGK